MSDTIKKQGVFGKKLRTLREARNWSREDLAAASGVSTAQLWRYEQGSADPTWGKVLDLAAALDVAVTAFLEDQDPLEEDRAFLERVGRVLRRGLARGGSEDR